MRRLVVFLKSDRTQNMAWSVSRASITTDEHGNIYLHNGDELLGVVSGQEFVGLMCAEVPSWNVEVPSAS